MKITLVLVLVLASSSLWASKVEVEIAGMDCGLCAESITRELKQSDKIENINVSTDDKRITFSEVKGKKISDGEVRGLMKKAGFEASKIRRH